MTKNETCLEFLDKWMEDTPNEKIRLIKIKALAATLAKELRKTVSSESDYKKLIRSVSGRISYTAHIEFKKRNTQ